MEIIIVGIILIFIITYRSSTGSGVYKFVNEQKNQLLVIRSMLDDNSPKELVEYVDGLLDKKVGFKYEWIGELNHLPLSGLKGLINYKLIEAHTIDININISISKDVNNSNLNRMSTTQKDEWENPMYEEVRMGSGLGLVQETSSQGTVLSRLNIFPAQLDLSESGITYEYNKGTSSETLKLFAENVYAFIDDLQVKVTALEKAVGTQQTAEQSEVTT